MGRPTSTMKLRLFILRNATTKAAVPALFFPNKPAARAERDKRNQDAPGTFCVSYGPDHRKWTGPVI